MTDGHKSVSFMFLAMYDGNRGEFKISHLSRCFD